MRKTKAEALQTRQDLLLSALNVFYQHGVARASLNEIARNAGVTRGALYWHFKNKEDLFDALFQLIFQDISQELERDINEHTIHPKDNLRQALINMFVRLQHNDMHYKFCNILHLKCEHTAQNQAIIALSQKYHIMWEEQLMRALQVCVTQNDLPADLDIAKATLTMHISLKGLMSMWLHHHLDNMDLSLVAHQFIDIALDTLSTHPALRQATT